MPFTVRRAFAVSRPRSDRKDLDMGAQRFAAVRQEKLSMHKQRMLDYEKTCATLGAHRHFLFLLLEEALRFQKTKHGVNASAVVNKLLEEVQQDMKTSDQYLKLIEKIASAQLFLAVRQPQPLAPSGLLANDTRSPRSRPSGSASSGCCE